MFRSLDPRRADNASSLAAAAMGLLASLGSLSAQSWRSELYPEGWLPPESASFTTDKLIQDFSYAGYRRGEEELPVITGPIFPAADYGADPTGVADSTAAIQAAIDAASVTGGVVLLDAGTYRIAPPSGADASLRIAASDVILRGAGVGQTFLFNDSFSMRGKKIITVSPISTSLGSAVTITADLDQPTRRIPVADASAFQAGDIVRMEWDFTAGWIAEHNQEPWWTAPNTTPASAEYLREVMAVDLADSSILVDVPTRYTMRTRDNARVRVLTGQLTGVGIEDFSIGNVQHPGTTWGEGDFSNSSRPAYDVHASEVLRLHHCRDSWVQRVESYAPAGNTSGCHMLSNGLRLLDSFRVTVANCAMRRSQYGGAGGNGYMYRIQWSHENLVRDCIADFSRHGLVVSHAGTSGNVFLRCEDRDTARSTGHTGSYTTNGSGSDHHMHFSHSNLFDQCHAHDSFYTAHHRVNFGTIAHGLTSAHGVYWNTSGSGTRGGQVVRSEQGRYGYVIGTSGDRPTVSTPTGGNTTPTDHVEGIQIGADLEPASLYLDQLQRRQQGLLVTMPEDASIAPTAAYLLEPDVYSYSDLPVSYQWIKVSGPATTFASPTSRVTTIDLLTEGTYILELVADNGQITVSRRVVITVDSSVVVPTEFPATLISIDQIIGRRMNNAPALGYEVAAGDDLIGVTGSTSSETRWDANVVFRYALPDLAVGSSLLSASLQFEITAKRHLSGADPGLDAYLLDVVDPAGSGTDWFYHGPSDPSLDATRIGGVRISVPSGAQVDFPPGSQVQNFVLDGAALAQLDSFYGGDHLPDRPEIFIRLNLDNLTSGIDGSDLDRHLINVAPAANAFSLSTGEPAKTFASWIGGFSLPGADGRADDPDGDGIPNAVEAWFGTPPDASSPGLSQFDSDGTSSSFIHPVADELPTDLMIDYEWSPNLTDWYRGDGFEGPGGGPTVRITADTAAGEALVTAEASAPMDRIFVRVSLAPR